jgi:Flp pilus assembly protein TadB
MDALDWQVRRRIELSSRRGVALDDPAHAALAAEHARRSMASLSWRLLSGPIGALLLWWGITSRTLLIVVFGALWVLAFAVVLGRLVVHRRAHRRYLMTADFDALRKIAQKHRTTYRRRY